MKKNVVQNKKSGLLFIVLLLMALLLAACGDNTATSKTEAFPTPVKNPTANVLPAGTPGPVPGAKLTFPQDEAPHDSLTEWWYYTGHFKTADGQRYGMEYVVFQGIRADFPVGYASHFAITDAGQNTFKYDQRISLGDKVKPGGTDGFNLKVTSNGQPDWTMQGLNGTDNLKAAMKDGTYAIDVTVKDIKGIALHGGGLFSYGPGGSSYYYSRPRMSISGTLMVGGQAKQIVEGQIWFDKQWGNFLPLAGGWDWYSTQLDDGSELMFYNLRDQNNNILQVFGTYLPPCEGACTPNKPIKSVDIEASDLVIKNTGNWQSPTTKINWPSGWNISIKAKPGVPAMELNYKPVLLNQELDTRLTTAVTYWEGDTFITGTKDGKSITGSGYVELTGYEAATPK